VKEKLAGKVEKKVQENPTQQYIGAAHKKKPRWRLKSPQSECKRGREILQAALMEAVRKAQIRM